MPSAFALCLHPDEVATGAALIVAAAEAVRQPQGEVLAAWDYSHTMLPYSPSERGVRAMLGAAAAALDGPQACVRFKAGLSRRAPGLVAAPLSRRPRPGHLNLETVLERLDTTGRAGGLRILVSNDLRNPQFTAVPAFRPGVLCLYPGLHRESLTALDAISRMGFATLMITPDVDLHPRSAHERLELCAALAACMAEGVRTGAPAL